MDERSRTENDAKVIHLRPPARVGTAVRRQRMRGVAIRGADVAAGARQVARGVLVFIGLAALQVVRLCICALLALIEPLLRATLVSLAFLAFLVTLLFGFILEAPGFPAWGMLGLSVSLVLAYWLFLGLMSLFMPLPPDYERRR